ncbi:MAG: dipeptidase [Longimicrobiales bacterium]
MDETSAAGDALAFHDRTLVFDCHTDTLLRVLAEGIDMGIRSTGDPLVHRSDLPRYKAAGVNAQVFAAWVDPIFLPDHTLRRGVQLVGAFYRMVEQNPDAIGHARTASDVKEIVASGRLAALLSVEGGDAIQNELDALRMYHRLGASSMTLCHSRTTDWIDSSTDAPKWNGLNDFGRGVIEEMNRLGMVVDVSHTSDQAARDVIQISDAPVVASHSSCRALCDHPRNLSDPLLEAIAETGGVVGINFYSGFLSQEYRDDLSSKYPDPLAALNPTEEVAPKDMDRLAKERLYLMAKHDLPRPAFSTILDHVDHAVSVVGAEHVALGSDLDVPHMSTPTGFDDVTGFPRITEGLLGRGYSQAAAAGILGGNWLRVFEQVTEC